MIPKIRRAALFICGLASAVIALSLLFTAGWSNHLKYSSRTALHQLRSFATESDAGNSVVRNQELISLVDNMDEAIEEIDRYTASLESSHEMIGYILLGVSAVIFIVWASLPYKGTGKANTTDA